MSRKTILRRGVPLALLVISIPLAFGAVRRSHAPGNGATVLGQVFQIVSQRFIDSLPEDSIYIRAARGLVGSLDDPYASFYNQKEISDFMRNTIGNEYGGLGMGINQQDSTIVVADVFSGSPAEKGGVERGDLILRIDTARTVGWTVDKVSQHLTGPVGTTVTVAFGRAGMTTPVVTTFTRAKVHAAAVPYTLMLDDHIGYIPLQRFNTTSGPELAQAVRGLTSRGALRFIVDLRANGGGDVEGAIEVSNVFLPKGSQVATQRERGQPPKIHVADADPVTTTAPVVVLVDGGTASASEIVAGSLQDHDRALVMGTQTFGKGLVQAVYTLPDNFALKLTTGKWYTPSGRSIHRDRKLVDGRLVLSDSGGDTVKAVVTHSDAGRPLVARGGISPDVTVKPDTFTTAEQAFVRVLQPKPADYRSTLFDIVREQHGHITEEFAVTPEMHRELRDRMAKAGVTFDDNTFQAGVSFFDDQLTSQALQMTFGDSAAARHRLGVDAALRRAMAMLKKANTQAELIKEAG